MQKKQKPKKFTSSMQKKLVVLFFIVLLAFAYLIIRIANINRDNGEAYKKQVLAQQSYDSMTLPYKRGSIEDKNGTVLAYSEKVYNLIVDAKLMSVDDGIHVEPTLNVLQKAFGELNVDAVRTYVNMNPGASYKKYLKWTDMYTHANVYPDYPADGISIDDFSPFVSEVPAEYNS